MFKLVSTILVISGTISAQLTVINQQNIESNYNLSQNNNLISYIDNNSAIIEGNLTNIDTPIQTEVIDSNWSNEFNYFILSKRGMKIHSTKISDIGEILYKTENHLIYKSKIMNLRQYDDFLSFDIVKLFKRGTRRDNLNSKQNLFQHRIYSEEINKYVQEIQVDSLWNMIRNLQDMERYTYSSGSNTTASYLSQYLKSLEMDTVYQDKYLSNGSPNIIGQKTGTENPENIIIICSHYDAARSGYPGADDNGSGTSGNLEIARVLSSSNFKNTIRFILFSGEENGLLGSEDYAQKVSSKQENINAVFNLDMISYLKPGDELSLDVCYDNQSTNLYNSYVNIAYDYLPELSICDSKDSPWKNSSDHKSFWDTNYPALYFGDDLDPAGPEHPNFHTLADTIGNGANSKDYIENVVKSVIASVATMAIPEKQTFSKNIPLNKNSNFSIQVNQINRQVNVKNVNSKFGITIANIYSIKGQLLFSQDINKNTIIKFSDYPRGSYLLTIKSNNSKFEKMIHL